MRTEQVIILRGELDYCDAPALEAQLTSLLAHSPLVIVSLRKLDFMDCAILGVIVTARNLARRQGGDLIMAGPHGVVRRLLDITGFPFRER